MFLFCRKIAGNLGKMWLSVVSFQKMVLNISRKTHEDLFLESYQKRSSWSLTFVEKFCRQSPTKHTGKFGTFGRIFFAPPKCACS